jgi:hypothetical protein
MSIFTVPLNEYEPSIHSNPMDETTWYSTTNVLEYYHQKPWSTKISGVNGYLAKKKICQLIPIHELTRRRENGPVPEMR